MKNEKNPLLIKSFQFGIEIVEYTSRLNAGKGWSLSNQLLRSGTSIGAQVCEAQEAQSRRDFIHKIKIAAKEARESRYWLILSQAQFPEVCCDQLLELNSELIRLTGKIISTAIRNQNGSSEGRY